MNETTFRNPLTYVLKNLPHIFTLGGYCQSSEFLVLHRYSYMTFLITIIDGPVVNHLPKGKVSPVLPVCWIPFGGRQVVLGQTKDHLTGILSSLDADALRRV